MAGNVHDWDDPDIHRAEPRGHAELKGLLLLIAHNAAQDACGRGVRLGRNSASRHEAIKAEARRWLMSDAEHGPAVDRFGLVQGASFRWICRMLDVHPDLAQQQIRSMGWVEYCDRMTEVTRSVRRGPETRDRVRKPLQAAQRDDRRAVDVSVAKMRENAATAIVEAFS